jgi:cytochrome c-type biogenesis protein CcmH
VRLLVALAMILALTAAAQPQTTLLGVEDAFAQARTTLPDVEDEVMCVECGTALNVSDSPVAEQERAFIRDRIAEGMTKEEIKAALAEEYGDDVLATPPSEGFNVTNWLVPAALAALALGGVLLLTRRWRSGGRAAPAAVGPDLDPDDARRLDADLAAFDR